MTSYPTPWSATSHKMKPGDYRGVLERRVDQYRAQSFRCPHAHATRGAAQRCADKALASPGKPWEVAP